MLSGGPNDRLAFAAGREPRRAERPEHAVVVVDDPGSTGFKIARPADLAIWMADVDAAVCVQQPDESSSARAALPPRHLQIDDVAHAEAQPLGTDERIDERENAVLKAKGRVPETRAMLGHA